MFNENYLKKLILKNHLNILFYNCDNYDYIIDFFKINKHINDTKIIQDNIEYLQNSNCYIFDVLNIRYIHNFKHIIMNIITKINIYTKYKIYIIIQNLDCNIKIQPVLFSIIEKNYNIDCIFILQSKNYNVSYKIKSSCINIRCNSKKYNTNKNLNLISTNYLNHIFTNRLNLKKIKDLSYILSCLNIPFNIIIKNLLYNILDIFEISFKMSVPRLSKNRQ